MPQKQSKVLILGHGEMGRAMELLLHRHALTIWERRPKSGSPPIELESVAGQQDFVLFCLPANPHFELATRLRPLLCSDCLCLTIAKGLDDKGRTAAQALGEALADKITIGALYGPMISEEIRAGHPAFAQAGTANAVGFARITGLFGDAPLYLEHTTDIAGISWAAVLKNVYAILFGVADELELGDNMRGYLTAAAVSEMTGIITGLGGSADAPRGLAGLGDLVTTATSAGSHHHELGRGLVRGPVEPLTGEGVHTLQMIQRHGPFDWRRFPLLEIIGRLLAEPATARVRMRDFLDHMCR